MGFNMLDKKIGGYSRKARKLRQAISIAVDWEEYIQIFINGRGEAAQSMLPPGIFGYSTGEQGINPYVYDWVNGERKRKSIAYARKLMVEAGYPNGIDPETKEPLLLRFDAIGAAAESKSRFDWFRKQYAKLGISLQIDSTDYNRFQDKMRKGNAQIYMWGWNADYPDPENFMFLLYGPNSKAKFYGENASNYDNPEFNRLFKKMETMKDGPERLKIIRKMNRIIQRDAPWLWGFHPKTYVLYHKWYKNAKTHAVSHNTWMYKRIDASQRRRLRTEWNKPVVLPIIMVAIILVLSLIPAIAVYRRKVHSTVKGERRTS
jgi:ABC-type transport system substrate-binding protein